MNQKCTATKMDNFLDSYLLLTNLKEVESKSVGRKFPFLHSLNPKTIKSEAADYLKYSNYNWAYDKKFNSRYAFGFVDCLLQLMVI